MTIYKYVIGNKYKNQTYSELVCVFTNGEYSLFENPSAEAVFYYDDDPRSPTPLPKIEVRTLTMFKTKGQVPPGRTVFGLGEVNVIKADEWVDKLGDVELTFVDNNLTGVRLV